MCSDLIARDGDSGEVARLAAEILRRAIKLGVTLEPLDGHRLRYHGPAAAISELQGALARHKAAIHALIAADREADAVQAGLAGRDVVSGGAQGLFTPPSVKDRDLVQLMLPFYVDGA